MSKNGSVYTKQWVVELMLDLAGYESTKNLVSCFAIEPSCGEGAFAVQMVERLAASARRFNRSLAEASDSLRLIDLDRHALDTTRNKIKALLMQEGLDSAAAETLLNRWCVCDDFLCMKEFQGADFVIGNPPYIRSNDIDEEQKKRFAANCETMTPGSDVFVGFIERGLKSLSEDGKLTFICADRWMHNSYGKQLRQFVAQHYCIENIIVMHDADAFETEVSAYPAITTIGKSKTCPSCKLAFANNRLDAVTSRTLRDAMTNGASSASNAFELGSLAQRRFTSASWPLIPPKKQALLDYLEANFPLLEDSASNTSIGIGMATGRDSVFVVSRDDVAENDRMIPMCTSRQLNKNTVIESPLWLVNPWDDNGTLVDLNRYPKLKAYYLRNHETLAKRHIAKKNPSQWFRTIDKYHAGLANRPKLLIQDMHARFEPFYDDAHYPHGNLYYLTSDGWDLQVLGGLLMSDICETFIDAYGVKMRGGTLRFQAQFLRKIRVPHYKSLKPDVREGLREAFLSKNYEEAGIYARKAFTLEVA